MSVIDLRERQVAAQTAQEVNRAFQGGMDAVTLLVERRREFHAAVELLAMWLERYSALQTALHDKMDATDPKESYELLELLRQHPSLSQWADELKQLVDNSR